MIFVLAFFVLQSINASSTCMYDLQKSFFENIHTIQLPAIVLPNIKRAPQDQWIDFLGYKIASPIGIPACPIMTSKGIAIYAQLGFDVLTYKTIRISSHEAHALPNIVYVDCDTITINQIGTKVSVLHEQPTEIAIANSFGNPSFDKEFCRADIKKAKLSLQEGQILIVSIFGESKKEFIDSALLAQEAGADIIEANFSCPNLCNNKSPLYENPELVFDIAHEIVSSIAKPLIIKVGIFKDPLLLHKVLLSATKAGVKGICGINAVSMKIVDQNDNPVFGTHRYYAGISGQPIKQLALDFIKMTKHFIEKEQLDLVILATGGVTKPEHFFEFLQAGAQIALSGTGSMWHPFLAVEFNNCK